MRSVSRILFYDLILREQACILFGFRAGATYSPTSLFRLLMVFGSRSDPSTNLVKPLWLTVALSNCSLRRRRSGLEYEDYGLLELTIFASSKACKQDSVIGHQDPAAGWDTGYCD